MRSFLYIGYIKLVIEMLIQIRKTIEPPLAAGGGSVALLGQKGENISVKMNDKCRRSGSFLFSVTQVLSNSHNRKESIPYIVV